MYSSVKQVNNILASFKRLKANAAEGGKPYREDTVEYRDTTAEGLNILVRHLSFVTLHARSLDSNVAAEVRAVPTKRSLACDASTRIGATRSAQQPIANVKQETGHRVR